jgi:hypothetical protein
LVKFFHEFGHSIYTTFDDPKLAQEAQEAWELWNFQIGKAQSMPPEILHRVRHLVARNERGASARALSLDRKLRENGIRIPLGKDEKQGVIEAALDTYRGAFLTDKEGFK